MKFKIGDLVYVPNALDMKWNPCLTRVEEFEGGDYYCKVPYKNMAGFSFGTKQVLRPFKEFEIFSKKDDCQEYINNYYYYGLCHGCKYEVDAGTILNCSICQHNIKVNEPDPVKWNWGYCENTGITVWSGKTSCVGLEICRNFSPTLPQYQDWNYEKYEDLLKNCEFNRNCVHHVESCHRTCSFEKYMDEFVHVPGEAEFEGREVAFVFVKRSEWVDQSFKDRDCIKCWGVRLKPELTKAGKLKKGTVNQNIMFDGLNHLKLNTTR